MADQKIKDNLFDRKSLYIKVIGIANHEFEVQFKKFKMMDPIWPMKKSKITPSTVKVCI